MLAWAGAFYRDLASPRVFVSYANDPAPQIATAVGGDTEGGAPSAAAPESAASPARAPDSPSGSPGDLSMALAAERIAYAIKEHGLDVFVDRQELRAGEGFNNRIRREIALSSLFVFLISERAVTPPNYALTEMKFAMQKWPNPHGRVLPVMMRETSLDSIPEYLKSVQILRPVGNVTAEVAAEAAKLVSRVRSKRLAPLLGAAAGAAALVAILAFGPSMFPEAGRSFRIYDGYVLNDPGEVIARDEVKSIQNCQARCERNRECKAFSYSPYGSCTLTETYTQFELQRGGKVGVLASENQPRLK